mgnify:CR=1 FL=1
MITPIRYRHHGDFAECKRLKGDADRVMIILESMMRLSGLKSQTIRFAPYDGSLIVARKFFGTRIVDIYASVPAPKQEAPEPQICLCNCNFSIGWVLEVQEYDTINKAQLYKVMACNNLGRVFVPYENVLCSDWTPREVGERVVMIPYNQMAYLCCTNKRGSGGPRGCSPTVSGYDKTEDEWRTTYRIIPVCSLTIPKLVEKHRWNPNG